MVVISLGNGKRGEGDDHMFLGSLEAGQGWRRFAVSSIALC